MKKIFLLLFVFASLFPFAQNVTDSITRKPPLRGTFRWIMDKDMYEEGNIHNNIKVGDWKRFYKGELSGKTVYKNGLAIAEYWNYKDTLKLRYNLSAGLDSMTVYSYDMESRVRKITKHTVDGKTFFLNYSLMTEDTIFKKNPVTEIDYVYELWAHRNDVVIVTETTGGIPNKKYYLAEGNIWKLWFETNDKGDFITGKKKEFLKEEEKSKKFLEEKNKVPK
ncbi:MAG: hypothetical protein IAF38_06745 [Bacteroidia bacterium]|nr:hypothetical protein [Bacteroidia bacterium]